MNSAAFHTPRHINHDVTPLYWQYHAPSFKRVEHTAFPFVVNGRDAQACTCRQTQLSRCICWRFIREGPDTDGGESVKRTQRRTKKTAKTSKIGARLKHARLFRGLTLQQVACQVGCSESLLSKIENDRTDPSLATLHRIVAALETNISAIFNSDADGHDVVFPPGQRPIIRFAEGIELERLIPYSPGHLMQANINCVAPGSHDELVTHQGEELGYVLEGEIELILGDNSYTASAGSSFYFRSDVPHGYRNRGKVTARIIWVNSPPTY
jgi:transcriptional regulator with XRE-family HTH domain